MYSRYDKQPAFSSQGSLPFHFRKYSSQLLPRTYPELLHGSTNVFANPYPIQTRLHPVITLQSVSVWPGPFLNELNVLKRIGELFCKMSHALELSGGFLVMPFSLFSYPLYPLSVGRQTLVWRQMFHTRGVGQFPWCKRFPHGCFRATNVTSLNSELEREARHLPAHTSSSSHC